MSATGTALTVPAAGDVQAWGDRKLDNEIRKGHSVAGAHMANYEAAATATGVLLRERKRRLKHGEWLPWVENHFEGSPRTAQVYISMADEAVPNTQPTAHLTAPEDDVLDGEIVEEDDYEPPTRKRQEAPLAGAPKILSDAVAPDASTNVRTQLVEWYDQGRRVRQLLDDGASIDARSDEDRELLLQDATEMAAILKRVKGRLK